MERNSPVETVTLKRGVWEAVASREQGPTQGTVMGGATNFHCAAPNCCHVMLEVSTDDDSSTLRIEINLHV